MKRLFFIAFALLLVASLTDWATWASTPSAVRALDLSPIGRGAAEAPLLALGAKLLLVALMALFWCLVRAYGSPAWERATIALTFFAVAVFAFGTYANVVNGAALACLVAKS
jgi:hypothetical protein